MEFVVYLYSMVGSHDKFKIEKCPNVPSRVMSCFLVATIMCVWTRLALILRSIEGI